MAIDFSLSTAAPHLDREIVRAFLDGGVPFIALPEPQWGPIGKEVFDRTYARTIEVLDDEGVAIGTRTESWAETVKRVVLGSLSYTSRDLWLEDEDVRLFDLIYNFKAIPAGRHLWVTGTPASTFSKNCWSAGFGARTSSHFAFLASRLLEGGGVGSNYSSDIMAATEPITGSINLIFALDETHADYERVLIAAGERLNAHVPVGAARLTVEDSREGWVDTWTTVIDHTVDNVGKTTMVLDLNAIRPFGAPLKTFGGTASGPDALVRSLIGITEVLNAAATSSPQGRRLSGLEAMAMDHELASAVVAGGSRRSARMAIMSWRDEDVLKFIHVKEDHQSHWTTNISVEIDDDFHAALLDEAHPLHQRAESVMGEVVTGMIRNGEPGMVDTALMSRDENSYIRITNPCVTGDTWVQTTKGLRQVNDLVGTGRTELFVNDEVWSTTVEGFFKTGHKKVLTLNVDGTDLRVTEDHLISTPEGWRAAGEIEAGDVVDLTNSLGNSWGGNGTRDEGYLLGHLIGDGYFEGPNDNDVAGAAVLCAWRSDGGSESCKARVLQAIERACLNHRSDWNGWRDAGPDKQTLSSAAIRDFAAEYGVVRGHKTITPEIMSASSEFVVGVIQGLFDTDGHVEGSSLVGGLSVRLSQSNLGLLSNVRTLLLALGIKSVVRRMKDAEIKDMPGGSYQTQDSYRLIIAGQHVERFDKVIGFMDTVKAEKLTEGMATMRRGFYEKPMVGVVFSVTESGTEDVYDCQVPRLNAFIANGTIVHNCGEVGLFSYDLDGLIAGESCNLGSVDLDTFGDDHEGAKDAFSLMARFLYRATLNPHADRLASHIESVNRRIGVGIMGLQGWCAAHGTKLTELENDNELRSALTDFRKAARVAADELAEQLGTPRAVKVTAVAPTGTIAQLRGSQPGIHPVFARYFIRRVRYSKADPGLAALAAAGYTIEDDIYAKNTSVVEFIVRDSILDRHDEALIEQSDEIDADQFFGIIATVQATFCGEGDGQAVSATAQIAPDASPGDLETAIRGRLCSMKGFTVFPAISRPQSPYETITAGRWADAVLSGLAQSTGDSNSGECVGGACPVR